jgi:hypothetical protein
MTRYPPGRSARAAAQTTHDVIANHTHAVALLETTVRRGDVTLTYHTAEIYHLRDGELSARWAFSDDTEAINRSSREACRGGMNGAGPRRLG